MQSDHYGLKFIALVDSGFSQLGFEKSPLDFLYTKKVALGHQRIDLNFLQHAEYARAQLDAGICCHEIERIYMLFNDSPLLPSDDPYTLTIGGDNHAYIAPRRHRWKFHEGNFSKMAKNVITFVGDVVVPYLEQFQTLEQIWDTLHQPKTRTSVSLVVRAPHQARLERLLIAAYLLKDQNRLAHSQGVAMKMLDKNRVDKITEILCDYSQQL
jgi:hypothetical protein